MDLRQKKILARELQRKLDEELDLVFDPNRVGSRATEKQTEVFKSIGLCNHRYVVAANQVGKSSIGARDVSWFIKDKHPYYKLRSDQRDRPLFIIIVGKVLGQVEEELWNKKLSLFFTKSNGGELGENEFKEIRSGQILSKVKIKSRGFEHTIVFQSHNHEDETREKVQSYVADYVWLDEMVSQISLLKELHLRVLANEGHFLATFTPKIRSDEIKKYIESPNPSHIKFKINMFDNPIYRGREEQILLEYKNTPENERNAILFGDWYVGDSAVYDFSLNKHVVSIPYDYTPYWRHLFAIDPAGTGKVGYVIIAEHPMTGVKYVIKAGYIKGKAASQLLDEIEVMIKPFNIVKKVSDPHETWFIEEARLRGSFYQTPYNKTGRKVDLIKAIQSGITDNELLFIDKCDLLLDEISTYQWSEGETTKIEKSTKYHIMDALQYGWDLFPRFEGVKVKVAMSFNDDSERYTYAIKQAAATEREKAIKRMVRLKKRR